MKWWKEGFLSNTGREVLINVVAQAIPTYIISSLKLPTGVCIDIERPIARFWWGAKEGDRKVKWLSWDNLSNTKFIGGLGFRGITYFKLSLIGK